MRLAWAVRMKTVVCNILSAAFTTQLFNVGRSSMMLLYRKPSKIEWVQLCCSLLC
jgi:hypothetical protein